MSIDYNVTDNKDNTEIMDSEEANFEQHQSQLNLFRARFCEPPLKKICLQKISFKNSYLNFQSIKRKCNKFANVSELNIEMN